MHFINDLLHQPWASVSLYTLAGGVISVVLQFIKHVGSTKWGHIVVVSLLAILSTVTSVAYYFIHHSLSKNAIPFVAQHAAYLTTLATFVYHLLVGPVYKNKIAPFLTDLATLRASKAPVVTPAATPEPAAPASDSFVA